MLLPSALSCDPSHGAAASSARLQAALFASPPASPPPAQSSNISGGALGFGNIVATCRSLQSLLGAPPVFAHHHYHQQQQQQQQPNHHNSNGLMIFTPPAVSREASCSRDDNINISSNNNNNNDGGARDPSQLPTPPLAHAPCPLKLRLRSRKTTEAPAPSDHLPVTTRKKIAKRAPPRGANKRRRATAADSDSDSDAEPQTAPRVAVPTSTTSTSTNASTDAEAPAQPLHTPKRARIAPAVVPMGLERSDFHALHEPAGAPGTGTDVEVEADGEAWSAEDDRVLVELVLEKLRLSREDWEDCARSLGRDRACLGRRWKSLMLHGDVGLRPTRSSSRRTRLHSTWR